MVLRFYSELSDYFHGSVHSFGTYAILQIGIELTAVSMAHTWLKRVENFCFNATILLWYTWGCLYKLHHHPFLFAGFLEGNIFTRIIAV